MLTLNSPVAKPALAGVNPNAVHLNLDNGAVTIDLTFSDGSGNTLGTQTLTVPPAIAAALLNGNKNAIYNHLQTVFGAGTVG
jgi:hypothetical protein